ncbi:MAG: anti-sigma factor [Saprospiraceae bacterium]|nr:anti-sigma factor [Saprospiraceae bacterium]MDW8230925.1 anti-sigma factor [Saprospiraceae bacterium]
MDVKSFIESGLLEAYALGQCAPEERALVERMLAEHPELRAELEAVERVLEQVAQAYAVMPPSGLKARLLAQAQAEAPTAKLPEQGRAARFWLVASGWAVALLLAGVLGWQLWEKEQRAQRIQALEKQVSDCEKRAQQQARLHEVVALLRDRDTRAIVLSDAAGEGPAKVTATVWHNPVRAETVLDINTLPAPPPGRYFQFWAIVEGKPVSMGMVNLRGDDAFQRLPFRADAQAFAISAEDNPDGNPTPTQVVLVGKI